jgi:hypothetical protein
LAQMGGTPESWRRATSRKFGIFSSRAMMCR